MTCCETTHNGKSTNDVYPLPRFPTAPPEAYDKAQAHQASYQPVIDPLCGMGIGLPVSRLYARHFGGDLRMLSLQGYG